jgi:hypothetical protein
LLLVLWIVNVSAQHRWNPIWVSKNPRERLDINRSLEYEESVSAVVGVKLFTICAKVPGAECTAVPLSNDLPVTTVAAHRAMCEVTKIRCRVSDT